MLEEKEHACGFCEAKLASLSSLLRHQTKAKYCLEKQKQKAKLQILKQVEKEEEEEAEEEQESETEDAAESNHFSPEPKAQSKANPEKPIPARHDNVIVPKTIYTPTVSKEWIGKASQKGMSDFTEIAKATFAAAVANYASKTSFPQIYRDVLTSQILSSTQKANFTEALQQMVRLGDERIREVLENTRFRSANSTVTPGVDPWIQITTPSLIISAINEYYAMYNLTGLTIIQAALKNPDLAKQCADKKPNEIDCSEPCSLLAGPLGLVKQCRFLTEEQKKSTKFKIVTKKDVQTSK